MPVFTLPRLAHPTGADRRNQEQGLPLASPSPIHLSPWPLPYPFISPPGLSLTHHAGADRRNQDRRSRGRLLPHLFISPPGSPIMQVLIAEIKTGALEAGYSLKVHI